MSLDSQSQKAEGGESEYSMFKNFSLRNIINNFTTMPTGAKTSVSRGTIDSVPLPVDSHAIDPLIASEVGSQKRRKLKKRGGTASVTGTRSNQHKGDQN